MLRSFLLIIITLVFNRLYTQTVDIGLFYGKNIKTFTFTTLKGDYEIQYQNVIKEKIKKGEIAYITLLNGYMQVRKKNNLIGTFKSISFIGNAKENYFSIREESPDVFKEDYLKTILEYGKIILNRPNLGTNDLEKLF